MPSADVFVRALFRLIPFPEALRARRTVPFREAPTQVLIGGARVERGPPFSECVGVDRSVRGAGTRPESPGDRQAIAWGE